MSTPLIALAVMTALLYLPNGTTQFTISQGQEKGDTKKAFGVKLHDGYWRVTTSNDPQGTDYKLEDGRFLMRSRIGRIFPTNIDQDVNWSSVDFRTSTSQASFKHPSMGSPLNITRGIPGSSPTLWNDSILTVMQESGWVKGFLVVYSKTDEAAKDGNAKPAHPANPTPPGTSAAEQPRVPGSGGS
jgi:hypothetical protein